MRGPSKLFMLYKSTEASSAILRGRSEIDLLGLRNLLSEADLSDQTECQLSEVQVFLESSVNI